MSFLKSFVSSCLGAMVAMLIVLVLAISILGVMLSDTSAPVMENSVLFLRLDGAIVEQEHSSPLDEFLLDEERRPTGLRELREVISRAKDDDKIRGIVVEVENPDTYYAALSEIRKSLLGFKQSGKWVIAFNDDYAEGAYYLASVSDKVYMNPLGNFEFNGLSVEFMSYKRLLDKLDVKPQVFRVGEYKSAVEPFIRETLSDENRLQLYELINNIQLTILQDISTSRNIEANKLKSLADEMAVRTPEDAVAAGLIDQLIYQDQLDSIITARIEGTYHAVTYNNYRQETELHPSGDEIAVVIAEGTIVPGTSRPGSGEIGADTYSDLLKKVREDDKVKAVVLRINSPGGESQASDMIWREVYETSLKKPVIASMGNYAASGGYYIAVACDTIVAESATITGSIGVYGMLFDISEFLGDKVGITFDEVKTGKFGSTITLTRPLNPEERMMIQDDLERTYDTFIKRVSEGRNMNPDDVEALAGGRVWTGSQALERGLIDQIGDMTNAIQIAVNKSGIDTPYNVRYYPDQTNFPINFVSQFESVSAQRKLQDDLGSYYLWYTELKKLNKFQGSQAQFPIRFTLD